MGTFHIEARDLCWIDGSKDDPKDLCLHGNAKAVIGERTYEFHATVSATALYLLKTVTEDHVIGKDNQMLPCCGHFMVPDKDLQNVTIAGCPEGIDWSVIHENGGIKLIAEDGYECEIDPEEYKAEAFAFADMIESFYAQCSPKEFDRGDKFRKDCFTAFWNEWRRRRSE